MKRVQQRRFLVEAVLAGCSALCLVVTLIWPDWIEATLGYDPDRHSGSLERVLVTALLIAAVAFGLLARREWKRFGVTVAQRDGDGV